MIVFLFTSCVNSVVDSSLFLESSGCEVIGESFLEVVTFIEELALAVCSDCIKEADDPEADFPCSINIPSIFAASSEIWQLFAITSIGEPRVSMKYMHGTGTSWSNFRN